MTVHDGIVVALLMVVASLIWAAMGNANERSAAICYKNKMYHEVVLGAVICVQEP